MATIHREPNMARWIGVRPGHNGDQVSVSLMTNGAVAIIYTVPAGKTLFLCGMTIGLYMSGAGVGAYVRVRNVADVTVYTLFAQVTNFAFDVTVAKSYWPPIEIPTGYDIVQAATGAGQEIDTHIHGWVE